MPGDGLAYFDRLPRSVAGVTRATMWRSAGPDHPAQIGFQPAEPVEVGLTDRCGCGMPWMYPSSTGMLPAEPAYEVHLHLMEDGATLVPGPAVATGQADLTKTLAVTGLTVQQLGRLQSVAKETITDVYGVQATSFTAASIPLFLVAVGLLVVGLLLGMLPLAIVGAVVLVAATVLGLSLRGLARQQAWDAMAEAVHEALEPDLERLGLDIDIDEYLCAGGARPYVILRSHSLAAIDGAGAPKDVGSPLPTGVMAAAAACLEGDPHIGAKVVVNPIHAPMKPVGGATLV